MKTSLVLGAGGFIGNHLVLTLKKQGHNVIGIDLKYPEFCTTQADEFIIGDLREQSFVRESIKKVDEIYQLAADMGGAGYVFTGDHDADILHNSALINLNVIEQVKKQQIKKVFYSSSACIYPLRNQQDPNNPDCAEHTAYPADPDSEYGWEKLFSERLYLAFAKNYNIDVKIARYHNIFGPMGTWQGDKAKAPAAICQKVATAKNQDQVKIWGTGKQTRSFLYVDECIEATVRLMNSEFSGPVNIGSEEIVTINQLAQMIIDVSGKNLEIINTAGPVGVAGRNSNNTLVKKYLGWNYSMSLRQGIEKTYQWINDQVNKI
jgi:nucleoside-diphosphate-sugar epimerase